MNPNYTDQNTWLYQKRENGFQDGSCSNRFWKLSETCPDGKEVTVFYEVGKEIYGILNGFDRF